MYLSKVVVPIAAVLFSALTQAQAAVLTFDNQLDAPPFGSFTEQGYTVAGNGWLASFGGGVGLHLDDAGTPDAQAVRITRPELFDADEFHISRTATEIVLDLELPDRSFSSVLVNGVLDVGVDGYRGGVLVASAKFTSQSDTNYLLSELFHNLDELRVGVYFPDLNDPGVMAILASIPHLSTRLVSFAPSAHFDLASVTLNDSGVTPVPLPPTLLLLAAPLVVLRRMRKA